MPTSVLTGMIGISSIRRTDQGVGTQDCVVAGHLSRPLGVQVATIIVARANDLSDGIFFGKYICSSPYLGIRYPSRKVVVRTKTGKKSPSTENLTFEWRVL